MVKATKVFPTGRASRGLIVCADDFAVNEGASAGIVKLAHMGRISATSAMVLSPRWAHDVKLLQDLRGRIDVGLHLDWTSAFAVAAGHGLSLGQAMRQALLGGFDQRRASKVIAQQLDLFELRWQAPPDYVDGHQHVHQFAGIREALVEVMHQRYGTLTRQPYLRISRSPTGLADLKSRVIAWMGANALEKRAVKAKITTATTLFGIYDFGGDGQRYANLMHHWLARASADSILMCHPALTSEPGDEIGAARAQEFAYLASAAFDVALKQSGWQLARGREILNGI